MFLHLTNGSAVIPHMLEAGITGPIVPWDDVLHEGPVRAGLNIVAMRESRADFLANCGWGSRDQIARSLAARDAALENLQRVDEIVLWFEHDLYDQLQILQILDRLPMDGGPTVTAVPGDDYLIGLMPGPKPGPADAGAESVRSGLKPGPAGQGTDSPMPRPANEGADSVMPGLKPGPAGAEADSVMPGLKPGPPGSDQAPAGGGQTRPRSAGPGFSLGGSASEGFSLGRRFAELFASRREVTSSQRLAARDAWAAFRSEDPRSIVAVLPRVTDLPHLPAALRRHLQQFPSTRNGLSRTEQQTLEALSRGVTNVRAVFLHANHQSEEAVFMGDAAFVMHIQGLTQGPRPLARVQKTGASMKAVGFDDELALTDDGRNVLAGNADRVTLCGIDRWLGGVHLRGGGQVWRWNNRRGTLYGGS